MSRPTPKIQIQFLKNIQRLLAEGRFTASYKFALLLALTDVAVERGDDSGGALTIPTNALAEKFIQYYWRQALPYLPRGGSIHGKVLQQNTDRQAKIVTVLNDVHHAHGGSLSAAKRDAKAWKSLVSQVDQVVRGMPLWKLQTVGNSEFDFLYDNVGKGKTVELKAGIAFCLRQFHGLIGDLVRGAWVRFIRGMKQNQDVLGTTVDLYEFLFGSDRGSLSDMVPILTDVQHGSCFYCNKSLASRSVHVDHFVPWSRYSLDLGHNFVLAHDKCNSAKADHVAAARHLEAWVERNDQHGKELVDAFCDRGVLHDLSTTLRITDWTYSQVAMADGLTWEKGRTMVPLSGNWERTLRELIERAA
ncbi:MAG: HNH endonuclease [Planctomycetaceae bacterium]|nr:HNH endonuclease [Planctomycetaceae bacterium]